MQSQLRKVAILVAIIHFFTNLLNSDSSPSTVGKLDLSASSKDRVILYLDTPIGL